MNSYEAFIDVFVSKVVKDVWFKASVISASNETHNVCLNHILHMNINEILQLQWMNIFQNDNFFIRVFKSLFYFKLWTGNIHIYHVLLKGEEWSALFLQQNTVNDTKALVISERMTRFDWQHRQTSLWWICLLKCVIKSSIRNSPQGNHHAFNYIDVRDQIARN